MTYSGILRKWSRCSWKQRKAVVRAFGMGSVCVAALRLGSYDKARRVMAMMAGPDSCLSAGEVAWAAAAGAGRVPGAKCLVIALVGEAMLGTAGYEPKVCIGVSTREGFKAHAWVELDGQTVIGATADGAYERLEPVGAAA